MMQAEGKTALQWQGGLSGENFRTAFFLLLLLLFVVVVRTEGKKEGCEQN